MLKWITFTGPDHTISKEDLASLCRNSPRSVEIAFLVSSSKAGTARYPTLDLAIDLADAVRGAGQKVAVHLCGRVAKAFLMEGTQAPKQRNLWDLLRLAGRVQVNASSAIMTENNLDNAQDLLAPAEVIFQLRRLQFPTARAGRSWLFDKSGGRGTEPSEWPALPTDQIAGLAGGLGPGRIAPLLARLGQTEPGYWIDMESSLRSPEDTFSRGQCERVLEEAYR